MSGAVAVETAARRFTPPPPIETEDADKRKSNVPIFNMNCLFPFGHMFPRIMSRHCFD